MKVKNINLVSVFLLFLFGHIPVSWGEHIDTTKTLNLSRLHHLVEENALQQLNQHADTPSLSRLVNGRGMFGRTALYLAKSPEMARWLLEHGADPAITNDFGDPVLLVVVQQGLADIAKQLLQFGADPHQSNAFGNTPLREAQWKRDQRIYHLMTAR